MDTDNKTNAEAQRTQRIAKDKTLRLFASSAPLRFAPSVFIRVPPWLMKIYEQDPV